MSTRKKMYDSNNLPPRIKLIERLNALTHGIGVVLSVIGTYMLLNKLGQETLITSKIAYWIYGLSLILLFMNSTVYHLLAFSKLKAFFQKLDHSAIYLLIAGTYTPYLMISLGGKFGYTLLILIWLLGIAGIFFEIQATDRFPRLSTFLYLGLGWMSVIIIYPLFKKIGLNAVLYLGLGGLMYSIGTLFYSMKSNRWMHVIWHLFVMAGAFCMFLSIFLYV